MKWVSITIAVFFSFACPCLQAGDARKINVAVSPSLELVGEEAIVTQDKEWTLIGTDGSKAKSVQSSDTASFYLTLQSSDGQQKELIKDTYSGWSVPLTPGFAFDVYTASYIDGQLVAMLVIANRTFLLRCDKPFAKDSQVILTKIAEHPLDRSQQFKLGLEKGRVIVDRVVGSEAVRITDDKAAETISALGDLSTILGSPSQ